MCVFVRERERYIYMHEGERDIYMHVGERYIYICMKVRERNFIIRTRGGIACANTALLAQDHGIHRETTEIKIYSSFVYITYLLLLI